MGSLKEKSGKTSQREKFKETARQIGVDESESAFKDKLRQIAKQPPKKGKPSK